MGNKSLLLFDDKYQQCVDFKKLKNYKKIVKSRGAILADETGLGYKY
jgi:hypothetical protein